MNTSITVNPKSVKTGGITALVVAAGHGSRMGGDLPKQYQKLAGRSILRHAIDNLYADHRIETVRVIIDPDHQTLYAAAVQGLDLAPAILGGPDRQASVMNGLAALRPAAPDIVLIHDAARPFVDSAVLDRLFSALQHHKGAIAALPVVDSVKRAERAIIDDEIDREGLWRAQTPQGFHYAEILAAHLTAAATPAAPPLTDDAAVARAAGLQVVLVDGDEALFKITSPADMLRAHHYCLIADQPADQPTGQPADQPTTQPRTHRIGQGFDVHRFGDGNHVTLAGVKIPHTAGLLGHSDADVGLHAVTDALLGALGAGDIGSHFPPSDDTWRGVDSAVFLAHAGTLIQQAGGTINNIDLTIVCEQPRIGPHRPKMQARMADILGLDLSCVSIKATTTERLGFTGRGEGIAAMAVCLITI